MKNLALIVSEAAQIERMLIESGGEVTTEIEAMLRVNELELTQKVDGYAFLMSRFSSAAANYKEKAKFYKQIAEQMERAEDTLRNNITLAMANLKTDEVKGEDLRFKMMKAQPKLVIHDENLIPDDYKVIVQVTEVDKDRLKEDLKIGAIEGAHLEQASYIRIFASTPKDKKEKAG